jgi:hypothetical protein
VTLEPPTGPAAVTAPIRVSSNSSQFIETSNTLAWAIAQYLGRSPIAPRTEFSCIGRRAATGTERTWTESRDQAVLAQERQLHN